MLQCGDLIDFSEDNEDDKLMDEFVISRYLQHHVIFDDVPDKLKSNALTCVDPKRFETEEEYIPPLLDFDVDSLDKSAIGDLLLEEMECPICLIEMMPPKKIFACSNAHLFCQNCKIPALTTCPKCREDFHITPPSRSKLAERWACKIYMK